MVTPGTVPLLRVEGLSTHFPVRHGLFGRATAVVRAVDDVSFEVAPGEVLGLVGESGCGKSTLGRSVLRLVEPTAGKLLWKGQDLRGLSASALRPLRRQFQVVFQDPVSSLDPRFTAAELVSEAYAIHGHVPASEWRSRVTSLFEQVGLRVDQLDRYPHEFSGGQRQRIGLARALAVEPELLVLDEPISALDVSIQAQVVNLLGDLRDRLGLAYLFISHDLRVVEHLADRVAVMYLGRLVEVARAEDLYASPQHPYTQALLSAVPQPDPTRRRERVVLQGDVPSPLDPPSGCAFHPRCSLAIARCREERPQLESAGQGMGHVAACFRAGERLVPLGASPSGT